MKLFIDKHVLLKPLDQVSKALPSKTPIEILTGILFRVDEGGLTLIAGDSSVSIKAEVSADDFEVIRDGAIVIPGRKIIEIVKKVPEDISVEVDGLQVKIKSGKFKTEISGQDATQYPNFPESIGASVTIPGKELETFINKTIFATCDKEDVPILTGIHFKFSDNKIKAIGCDRHRLALYEGHTESDLDMAITVARGNIAELVKIIEGNKEVQLSVSPNQFMAKVQGFTFYSQVLEGSYPDAEKNIPSTFVSKITVDSQAMNDALDRVHIIAKDEKTNQIILSVTGEELEISAKVGKGSGDKAAEVVDITDKQGDDFKIAINAKYVLDALKAIDSEKTIINFSAQLSPVIFKGIDEPNNTQLSLPYRFVEE